MKTAFGTFYVERWRNGGDVQRDVTKVCNVVYFSGGSDPPEMCIVPSWSVWDNDRNWKDIVERVRRRDLLFYLPLAPHLLLEMCEFM